MPLKFKDIWEELRAQMPDGEGWMTRRVYPASQCPVFAAVNADNGAPGLLLEVQPASIPSNAEYPTGQGFEVAPVRTGRGRNAPIWLVLTLTGTRYSGVFEILADDVASLVANARDERQGVRDFLSRLRVWQDFMRRHGTEGLGRQAQTGLFSELFFLRQRLMPHMTAYDAVSAWTGPSGGVYDFVITGSGVEIKSTIFSPPSSFKVSNLAQLDDSQVSCLYLIHYTWQVTGSPGTTLPELVDTLRNELEANDPAAVTHLNERLIQAGYLDSHRENYSGRQLRPAHERFFRVEGEFPRLRGDTIPQGIVECSYMVDLNACASWETSGTVFTQDVFEVAR